MSKHDDLWSQLLGAAQTEAEKKNETPAPAEPPEAPAADDPWAQLLSAAEEEAARQSARSPEPAGVVYPKGSMLLDTYRVESNPMHGGMGSVWRVHHTGWNVDLARKQPQPQMFAAESSKEDFIRECRNWIDLGLHPNIVSCYYVREIDGVPAIFSEWMENGDLEHHIQSGTLYDGAEEELQARLLDIAVQYARGLRYAHEQGLIHQDVKPANLLLGDHWQAKAADFGLAGARAALTVLEGDPTQRDAGQSLSAASGGYTPAYCSMEQMDGKKLTRRTDIYSWAVSVMEMYIGARPWQNGVVAGAGCRDYMAMEDCRVKMPDALQDLLAKCMEMDADDRPHDFAEVEAELKQIYRDVTGEDYPRPEPAAAPDTADSLNNRALSYLDLGMPEKAKAIWQQALFENPSHIQSVFNSSLFAVRQGELLPGEAQSNVGLVHAATGEGIEYVVHLDLELGPRAYDHAWEAARRSGSRELEDEISDAAHDGYRYTCRYALSRIRELPEILRQEQKYEQKAASIRSLADRGKYIDAAAEMAGLAADDPDFMRCIYRPDWMSLSEQIGRHGFPVYVDGHFHLLTVNGTTYEDDVSFSDDSTRFLCGGRLYDLRTGALLADHKPAGVKTAFSKLSPDGTFLLRGRYDRRYMEKIDALTGETLERYDGFRDHMCSLAISRDGTTLAACDESSLFRVWTNGEEVYRLDGRRDPMRRIWISPDNRDIVFTNWNYGRVSIAHIDGRRSKVEELDFEFRLLLDVAVNADFTLLVAGGGPDGYLVYDLKRRKVILRESQRTVRERVRNVYNAAFLPNDRFFAYVSTNEVWYFSHQLGTFFGLFGAGSEIGGVAVSRDWKYLAYCGADDNAKLYRAAYTWYVPPVNGDSADEERIRFVRRHYARHGLANGEQNIADGVSRLKKFESAYSDASVLPAYAQILHGAHPEAAPGELLPLLMEELAARGYCRISREQALEALKNCS